MSKLFEAADTNSDGSVSTDEAKALQTKINESRSMLLSIQEDGSSTDATGGTDGSDIVDLFGDMDTDGSGDVSTTELSSAKDEMASRAPPPGPPPGGGGPGGASGSNAASGTTDASSRADGILKLLDTSRDGTISKDEISLFLQNMASAA